MASKNKGGDGETVVIAKTPSELQKMRLDKLMKNPNKDVMIPDKSKEHTPRDPQEFIRNVWGSSAGAGSGDFHVYRGVRRREYARQKFITEKAKKESHDDEYRRKVEENKKAAEERTAKKRAKRLKKKSKQKAKKPKKDVEKEETEESDEEEEEQREEVVEVKEEPDGCEGSQENGKTVTNGNSGETGLDKVKCEQDDDS